MNIYNIRKESLDERIIRRNRQLKLYFEKVTGKNIELICDKNRPKVIVDRDKVVNGFIHNFIFNFTTKLVDGRVVDSYNIEDLETVDDAIDTFIGVGSQKVYKICDSEGFTFIKFEINNNVNAAMWSKDSSRYFFDIDKAKSYLNSIHSMGYEGVFIK